MTVDEQRKAIESLPPEAYDRTAYYEKWIVALAQCMIQRGVITRAELARKMQDVSVRAPATTTWAGCRRARSSRTEHDYAEWERRVDAMAVLLGSQKAV